MSFWYMPKYSRYSFLQRGATLVVSLMMLLVLTIIGLAAINVTTQEEKMAGNSREQATAFQNSETALRVGEQTTEILSNPYDFGEKKGLVSALNGSTQPWRTFTTNNSLAASGVTGRYMVELINDQIRIDYMDADSEIAFMALRISGYGVGVDGSGASTVQSDYITGF